MLHQTFTLVEITAKQKKKEKNSSLLELLDVQFGKKKRIRKALSAVTVLLRQRKEKGKNPRSDLKSSNDERRPHGDGSASWLPIRRVREMEEGEMGGGAKGNPHRAFFRTDTGMCEPREKRSRDSVTQVPNIGEGSLLRVAKREFVCLKRRTITN